MGDEIPQGESTGESTEGQVPSDSLASGFLANVPETDRNVVEQYVKDWDAGVTRKFQEIHDTYKPYKEIGSVEDIQAWKQINDIVVSNPQHVITVLAQELGFSQEDVVAFLNRQAQGSPQTQQPSTAPVGSPAFQGLPPEVAKQLEEQDKLLKQLAQTVIGNHQASQQAEEDRQLDELLSGLKAKHGDFDEQYVLLQMYKGADPDKAVEAYKKLVGQSSGVPAPPVLAGGGIIPQSQKGVGEMNKNEVQSLVAGILQGTTQES